MQSDHKLKLLLEKLYACAGIPNAAQCAAQAMDYLNHPDGTLQQDLSVRALKGGTYKIKGYYMEDNDLTDIRGASTLISEVQNTLLPQRLCEMIGFDCILYNGGGNLLALVSGNTDPEIVVQLEQEADAYLVTANSAYYLSEPFLLSEYLGNEYRNLTAKIENGLSERKKAKLHYDPKPESQFVGHILLGHELYADQISAVKSVYCEKCRKRLAVYNRKGKTICGGCLHKVHVGETEKSGYLQRYAESTGKQVRVPASISDIDRNRIAVVYADGNNMGGIIQHLNSITKMMDFSEFVKGKMNDIVFQSLAECNITSPEIIALGGDDIFLLVPAEQSVQFAVRLTERYQKEFSEKFPEAASTLSVGFCIMKPDTPIKVALEVAEEELSAAKELVRANGGDGSISFRVFNTYEGAVSERGAETLMPYSVSVAKQLLKYTDAFRQNMNIFTKIQNLNAAFRNAEILEEASMFLDYFNAKSNKPEDKIILPELDGYSLSGGYYSRTGNYQHGHTSYLWNDLMYLLKFGNRGDTA